jgi:hypothetical protein
MSCKCNLYETTHYYSICNVVDYITRNKIQLTCLMDKTDLQNSGQWLSYVYDPHIDRDRSKLTLCPAKQLPDGTEHPLKLVDEGFGKRTPLLPLGQEVVASTASGSSDRHGEHLSPRSSLMLNKNCLFSNLNSLENSCLTTGLTWLAMGLQICRNFAAWTAELSSGLNLLQIITQEGDVRQ